MLLSMPNRARFVVIALTYLTLAGCRGPAGQHQATARGKLTTTDFAKLKAINDAQAAGLQQMQRLTASHGGACRTKDTGRSPANVDGWSTRTKVEPSDRCPMAYLNEWTYDAGARTLVYRHEMKVQRTLNVLDRKAHGLIRRTGPLEERVIEGAIRFEPMLIENVGPVEVQVKTAQTYRANKGRGELRVKVAQNDWSHEGVMRWRVGGASPKTIYEVDGAAITEDGFNALFSSYGLPEIMANSMKMR